jgi:uncharacterized membrane protein YgaE (UPF0421/DUF939 family)
MKNLSAIHQLEQQITESAESYDVRRDHRNFKHLKIFKATVFSSLNSSLQY